MLLGNNTGNLQRIVDFVKEIQRKLKFLLISSVSVAFNFQKSILNDAFPEKYFLTMHFQKVF